MKARNVVLGARAVRVRLSWSEVDRTTGGKRGSMPRGVAINPLRRAGSGRLGPARVLARQVAPTVLVGHSSRPDCDRGRLTSERGRPLSSWAARAPDAGEDIPRPWPRPFPDATRLRRGWSSTAIEGRLTEAAFLRDFAGDLAGSEGEGLMRFQEPFQKALPRARTCTRLAVEAKFLCPFPEDWTINHRSSKRFWPSVWAPRPSR